jgi:hypothetical protein
MSIKEKVLNPTVQKISDNMIKSINIDSASGNGDTTTDVYADNIPETLTPEIVKEVNSFNDNFVAASHHAFGILSIDALTANKDLDRTTLNLKMSGRDSLSLTFDRKREYKNNLSGGEKIVKYGVMTNFYDVRAGKNSGELAIARSIITELAFEKLK